MEKLSDASVENDVPPPEATTKVHVEPTDKLPTDRQEDTSSDDDDEKKEEKEEEPPKVTLGELFRYADATDVTLMVFGGIAAFAAGAGMPAFSLFFGQMLDELAKPGADFQKEIDRLALTIVYVGLIVLVLSIVFVITYTISASRQASRIRVLYFASLMRQDIGWHDEHKPGELVARLSGDTRVIQNGINDKFANGINMLGMLVFGFAFGFTFSWKLTLVMMATMPVIAASTGILTWLVVKLSVYSRKGYAQAGESSMEALENIKTVQTFGSEDAEAAKFDALLLPAKMAGMKKEFFSTVGIGASYCIFFCSCTLAFWYSSILVRNGDNTVGEIFGVFWSVLMAMFALGLLEPSATAAADACGAAYSVYAVIDQEPTINTSKSQGVELQNLRGNISFNAIDFAYQSRAERKLFSDLSLGIKAGTTVAFSGPSGCGKSTVVSLIQRFYDPQAGSISIDGKDLKDIDLQWWRTKVSTVAQEPALFSGTVADNIRVGKKDATMEEIIEACKQADAHEFVSELPKGYETNVGAVGSQLSGGQKQRIAIARAIVKRPSILLLDEATSALDRKSEAEVQAALEKAMINPDGSKRTVIVVAHRLTTIRNADCIYYIEPPAKGNEASGSRITESGTFDELLEKKGRFAAMAATQMQVTAASPSDSTPMAISPGKDEKVDKTLEAQEHHPVAELKSADDETDEWIQANEGFVLKRVAPLNRSLWWAIGLGLLGSVISSGGYPAFSIAFGKMLTLYAGTSVCTNYTMVQNVSVCMNSTMNFQKVTDETPLWAGMFAAIGGAVLLGWTLQGFYAVAGEDVTLKLRSLLFRSLLRQDQAFFDSPGREVGALAGHLSGDAEAIHQLWGPSIGFKIQISCTILGGFIIALIYSWRIALVTAAAIPLLTLSGATMTLQAMGLTGTEAKNKEDNDKGEKELTDDAIAAEAITNIRTVVAFSVGDKLVAGYMEKTELGRAALTRLAWIISILFGIGQFAFFGAQALAFWYGGKLIARGEEDFESVMIAPTAILFGAAGAGEAAGLTAKITDAEAAAKRVFSLIDRVPFIDIRKSGSTAELKPPLDLALKNVTFSYPARPDVTVLKKLDAAFPSDRTFGLMGATGCGKSTIMQLLNRFYDPQKGSVLVNGGDLKKIDLKSWRENVSIVLQEPSLFSGSVKANIRYGRPSATDEEVEEVAKIVAIHDEISAMHKGYDTNVGYRGRKLSGGQKQRVAIARALLRRPHLLLLDEATSALDNTTEAAVQAGLAKFRQDHPMTVISIAHRLTTIRGSNRILLLDTGAIAEQGTHEELVAMQGEYKARWDLYEQSSS